MTNQLIESIVLALFGAVIAVVAGVTGAGLEIIILGCTAAVTGIMWIVQTLVNKNK